MALGRTARFYRSNAKSRKNKQAYDKEYNSSEKQKKYRADLNKERRRRNLKGDKRDLSHTKSGSLVLESKKKNRARNGHGKNDRLK